MTLKALSCFLTLLIGLPLMAQEDSNYVLGYSEFIKRVKEHHPKMLQANIVEEIGAYNRQVAKGAFDPKLEGEVAQKRYDNQMYYGTASGGLKIPTWLGLTGYVGYDLSDGTYLNPQFRTPQNGLLRAGVELELGNGLFIDERRAELKKAKLLYSQSQAQQKLQQNELIFEASLSFQKWYTSYQKYKTYERSIKIAQERYTAILNDVKFGERAAIDTVEAGIQLQNRKIGFNAAKLEWQNNERLMELYLWNEGTIPLVLNQVVPKENDEVIWSVPVYNDSIIEGHPYKEINELLVQQLEIDIRLKKEQLKPSLSLKYNAIAEPLGPLANTSFNPNNYLVGAAVSYPIFTRKERANVNIYELKKLDTELKQKQVLNSLAAEVKNAFNSYETYVEMEKDFQQNVTAYSRLLEAENMLFKNGESSLFMINSREKALIDSELAYYEIRKERLASLYLLNYLTLSYFR